MQAKADKALVVSDKFLHIALFFLYCVGALLLATHQVEGDTLWHIKAGEYMVIHKTVLTKDVFTWTAIGSKWTAHEWLWEILAYLVWKAGGAYGIWLFTLLGFAFFTGVAQNITNRKTIATFFYIYLLVHVAWQWTARPYVHAYMAFALLIEFLEKSIQQKNSSKLRQFLYALFLFCFWANIHSSVTFGLAVFVLYVIAYRKNFAGLAGALIGTTVNPQGVKIFLYTREASSHPEIVNNIVEWFPLNSHNPFLFFSFLIILATIIYATYQRKNLFYVLLAAIGLAMAVYSQRHITYAIFLATLLAGKMDEPAWNTAQKALLTATLTVLASVFVIGNILKTPDLGNINWIEKPAEAVDFPVKAVEFMKEHGYTDRVFNYYSWGGYLIFNDIKPFIDGRADMYVLHKRDVWNAFSTISSVKPGIKEEIQKFGIKCFVLPEKCPLAVYLQELSDWEPVYRDDIAVVFVKKPGTEKRGDNHDNRTCI